MKPEKLCTLLLLLATPWWQASAGETEIYSLEKVNTGKSGPWSGDGMEIQLTPGDDGKLQFKLDGLPPHQFMKLELKLFIAGGSGLESFIFDPGGDAKFPKESQERLKIRSGKKTLLDSSFSSSHVGQSYPDMFGTFSHKPGTGSEKVDEDLGVGGIIFGGEDPVSGIYELELLIPHSGDRLELDFDWIEKKADAIGGIIRLAGGMFGGGLSSPYTITGLNVSALDGKPEQPLDAKGAAALLDAMASDKPSKAHSAMQELILTGDAAMPFIRERFTVVPDPNLDEKFEAAAEALRSEEFKTRAKAEADLIGMGTGILPQVIEKLTREGKDDLAPDYRMGLEKVKKKLQESAKASSDQALANRLHHVLSLIDTDEAKKTKTMLPPVKKLTPYVAPDQPKGFEGLIDGFEGGDFDIDP